MTSPQTPGPHATCQIDMRSHKRARAGQYERVELGQPRQRRTRVMRIVCVATVAVIAAACSASRPRASSSTSTQPLTTRSTSAATNPPMCRGCGLPHVTPGVLCAQAFGNEVVGSAETTVGVVRRSGIGLVGGVFKAAFPGVDDAELAAWCMLSTSPGCYDESAVAVNGARQHIAAVGCGWAKRPPHAGPPIWTD